jgi:hypothetical protein
LPVALFTGRGTTQNQKIITQKATGDSKADQEKIHVFRDFELGKPARNGAWAVVIE